MRSKKNLHEKRYLYTVLHLLFTLCVIKLALLLIQKNIFFVNESSPGHLFVLFLCVILPIMNKSNNRHKIK